MDIEKTLLLDAPPARVWALLLDPAEMGRCVPGMESVEVLSEDEYLAVMKVKISFISARFRLRTRIVERDAPRYLRAEGTGEDASVASSLKQTSEMWLAEREGGGTELRMKVVVDVLGRIGTFGLGVMKTKADRLWDEFGVNASARLAGGGAQGDGPAAAPIARPAAAPAAVARAAPVPASAPVAATVSAPAVPSVPLTPAPVHAPAVSPAAGAPAPGFWSRLFGGGSSDAIHVEVQRGDTRIAVRWPANTAPECAAWLRTLL